MTLTWHLRGFDKETDVQAVEFEIPRRLLPQVRDLLPEARRDPDFADPHEVTADQAAKLGHALGIAIDPERYHYSVESDEDPFVVAALAEAARAKA
jgi:hypothetical protein